MHQEDNKFYKRISALHPCNLLKPPIPSLDCRHACKVILRHIHLWKNVSLPKCGKSAKACFKNRTICYFWLLPIPKWCYLWPGIKGHGQKGNMEKYWCPIILNLGERVIPFEYFNFNFFASLPNWFPKCSFNVKWKWCTQGTGHTIKVIVSFVLHSHKITAIEIGFPM